MTQESRIKNASQLSQDPGFVLVAALLDFWGGCIQTQGLFQRHSHKDREFKIQRSPLMYHCTECSEKIAHCPYPYASDFCCRRSIAGNAAARIVFTRFHRRKHRGSLAIFFAEEIAHLGASK